jgi:hypothetical protein
MLYIIKLLISAVLIVVISEVSKRDTWLAGLLASLPLVSLLAIVWLYAETRDVAKISAFSMSVFWLVLPSLSLFVVLPLMLKAKFGFWPSLASAIVVMFACYLLTMMLLRKLGVHP